MAGQKFTLTFDAQLNIGQMKGAIGNIQNELSKLQLPQNLTRGISSTLSSLEKEIRNFEVASGKDLGNKNNFNALERSAEKIQSLFKDLQIQARDLGSNTDLSKFFPQSIVDNIQKGKKALEEYSATLKTLEQQQARAQKNLNNAQNRQTVAKDNLDAAKEQLNDFQQQYESTLKQIYTKVKMNPEDIFDAKSIEEAMQKVEGLFAKYKNIQEGLNSKGKPYADSTKITAEKQRADLEKLIETYRNLATTIPQAEKALKPLETAYTNATNKVKEMQLALEQAKTANESGQAEAIKKVFEQLNAAGVDTSGFEQNLNGAEAALRKYAQTAEGDVVTALEKLRQAIQNNGQAVDKTKADMEGATDSFRQFNEQMRDVGALKSRIKYFFGLNNAINLVRRAIHGAFDTIKELDAAMTETAVVTNYSVKDMWNQLPEYTKRANELGVTTKDAYESATLYFQQGLNNEQAAELSVETLKMARIAGLEAADATDRMTNALRGFNMELNTTDAQRVDDVYSQLAAMSASNVDEISTAMTKVASLAHSANMEFETTAAFLAQIIETTRESAETAGTALKTVVARFSEVKKLYDLDELRGTDEEGQAVDVNKVSSALRTAGIDLNRYFLGEVGLDDIFMELASKWDSLTSVQQRYIATQAAGSRQQSRFIALMQDYARTQELVGAAYDANGASARQFEKTQESLQSKLARLKNAWDEFLMGLTNNVMVKSAVDFLTNLLNVVNKLTTGFDGTTSAVLKFIASVAGFTGIKSLFATGGLVDKGLMSLVAGTGLGNAAVGSGLLSGLVFGNKPASGLTGESARRAQEAATANRIPLIFGADSLLSTAGKTAWGGLKNIGTKMWGAGNGAMAGVWGAGANLSGSAGLAAGFAGLATALVPLAAAITAVTLAVKAWEKFSAKGQLKTAQKEAEKLTKTAEEEKQKLDSLNSLQDTYKEKNQEVINATTVSDRKKAIQDRNEAITEAIKSDNTLAKYVITESVDNEIVLTINEDALSEAIKKVAEEAKKAEAAARFGESTVDVRQAKALEKKLDWAIRVNNAATGENIDERKLTLDEKLELLVESANKQNDPELVADYYDKYNKIVEARNSAQQEAQAGYALSLQQLGFSDELINSLTPILGEVFTNTLTRLDNQQLNSIAQIDKSVLTPMLQAAAGQIDFSLLDIDLDKDFSSFLNVLGLTEEDLQAFSDVIGDDTNLIETTIKARAKEVKAIQENQKKAWQQFNTRTAERTIQIGNDLGWNKEEIASSIADFLALQSFEEQAAISQLLDSISNSELAGIVLKNLDDSGLREWITSLDFSNPIKGLLQLQDAASNGQGKIQQLGESLQNASEYSATSLLTYFTQSTDYDALTESLAEFIDENNEISSSNIIDLAESNKTLNDLLKTGTISAKALAVALTGIETGKFQTWDLNDAIIEALNSMDDLDGMVKRTIDDLNSFDPGYDENDVTEFINKVVENVTGNIEKGAWGNNQMRNYMEYIFGSYEGAPGDEYTAWLQNGLSWLEANKENMQSAWSDIAYASEEAAIASGKAIPIWQENGEIVVDIGKHNTEELVSLLKEQTNLTEQQIRMMIADYKNYSDDFALTLERNDTETAVEKWAQKVGEKGWYLDKDLQTLATALGVDVKTITDTLKGLGFNFKEIKFGEGSVKDIERILAETGNQNYYVPSPELPRQAQKAIEDSVAYQSSQIINFDQLKQDMANAGLSEYFESTINEMRQAGESFVADFGNGLETITINAGETASEAYARAAEEAARKALASDIGEAVVGALGEAEVNVNTDNAKAAITEFFGDLSAAYNTANSYSANINISTDSAVSSILNLASAYDTLAKSINNAANAGSTSGGTSGGSGTSRAKGGYVESYGSGSYRVAPGPALTGEEGPEIVWNKEKGYAYITGQDNPEFQNLQPGDRVFNAQETRKILKGSSLAHGGIVNSYATRPVHGYGDAGKSDGSGSGSGSGSGDKSNTKKESTWRNELDWLYDLMEDIAEYERQQTLIQAEYKSTLEDSTKKGLDLYNLTRKELVNLETQRDAQEAAYYKRMQQMSELQTQVNAAQYGQYVQWNQKDQTLEINWDKIEAIQDKDTYDEVTDWLKRMETVQGQIDDAEKSLVDIDQQIQELQQRYLQQYLDFQNRVLQAVVKQYQDQIDKLSELNGTLNDTNASILDSIQREIDLERQIRDNTDTESDIADMEARLAYLQRDTTGANATEIRQLQQQLSDARENYSDSLIDQAVDRLAQSNDDAAAARDKQVELMQAQLDYLQQSGGLWSEVDKLMAGGFGADGSLVRGSDLEKVLRNAEDYDAMSQAQRDNWANELILETNQVGAHILEMTKGLNVTAEQVRALSQKLVGALGGTPEHSYTAIKTEGAEKYATGGLNTYTGLAHLDGTPSAPEYVLNPEQTNAFLRLADVLPSIMGGDSIGGTTYGGNIYLNLDMHVDEIGSDYDVDRIADRVKDIIYDASSYRNVNTLNFIR